MLCINKTRRVSLICTSQRGWRQGIGRRAGQTQLCTAPLAPPRSPSEVSTRQMCTSVESNTNHLSLFFRFRGYPLSKRDFSPSAQRHLNTLHCTARSTQTSRRSGGKRDVTRGDAAERRGSRHGEAVPTMRARPGPSLDWRAAGPPGRSRGAPRHGAQRPTAPRPAPLAAGKEEKGRGRESHIRPV